MLILGIETATAQVGVAIGGEEGVLASAHSARDRRHAESLAPQIEFVCSQARIGLDEIGCVAVDVGPGLYTGLRVGLASAMASAQGLGVPMIGVPSLDLVAHAVGHSRRDIVSCFDARRGEVFSARYRFGASGMERTGEPQVSTPEELAAELSTGAETLLVGDGVTRYGDVFEDIDNVRFAGEGLQYPSARSLVEIARPIAEREEFVAPSELKPLYLRLPDAEINWKTRDSA